MTPTEADKLAQQVTNLLQFTEHTTKDTSIGDLHVADDRGGTGNWVVSFSSGHRYFRRLVGPLLHVDRLPINKEGS